MGVLDRAEQLYRSRGAGVLQCLALFDAERANVEAGQRWTPPRPRGSAGRAGGTTAPSGRRGASATCSWTRSGWSCSRAGTRPTCLIAPGRDSFPTAPGTVWPALFERQRRVILAARLLAVRGRVQREGEVVHLIAHRLHDLSRALASVGDRDAAFSLPHGCGDELRRGTPAPNPRDLPPRGMTPRDIDIPDLHIDTIMVRTRDFR